MVGFMTEYGRIYDREWLVGVDCFLCVIVGN